MAESMKILPAAVPIVLGLFLGYLPVLSGGSFGISDIYDSPRSDQEAKFPLPQPVPQYVFSDSGNVTAVLGKAALLNCKVRGIGNKTVSWIRHQDTHLLTVGRYTYTSDERFRAIHKVLSENFLLQILPVKLSDRGLYECQISTTPVMSHTVYLAVAEPVTEILGGPDIYIEEGVTMNITCLVRDSPEPPNYIFWYHNGKTISYDSPRGGVSQITEKGDTTASFLLVQHVTLTDSGRYECSPSVGEGAGAEVHVIRGADPEKWLTSSDGTLSVGKIVLTAGLCLLFILIE